MNYENDEDDEYNDKDCHFILLKGVIGRVQITSIIF